MSQTEANVIHETLLECAESGQWDEVRRRLEPLHPADLADLVSRAPSDIRERLFDAIDEEKKPDVLAELEGRAEKDVLESLSNAEISELVEEMSPDDAADLIADLSDERSEQVLDLMEDEESEEVRELLQYDEESAGGLMTPDLLILHESLSVETALQRITDSDEDEPIYYAYVVNERNELTGYIGLWEMLKIKDRSVPLSAVAHRDVISANVHMDQEEVARLMSKYDLTAIPVVDDANRLVGRITVDDVLDVLEDEASEDIFLLAGSDDSELNFTSPWKATRARLPWILITLFTGFITSLLLREFMSSLAHVLVLTFFVPIVLAMGGNTGIQSSTLMVRSIALGAYDHQRLLKLLGREVITGAIMGLFSGVVIALWAHYIIATSGQEALSYSPLFLSITVGLALFSAMVFAALYGAFVPVILNRLGVDPAVASGPFVTSSNDITALIIYYLVTMAAFTLYHGGT